MRRRIIAVMCLSAAWGGSVSDASGQDSEQSMYSGVTISPHVAASFHPDQLRHDLGLALDMKAVGLRVEKTVNSTAAIYGTVDRLWYSISCAGQLGELCPDEGWSLVAGINLRTRPGNALVPYVGAGGGVLRWEDGSFGLSGEAHVGLDVPIGPAGLRFEARVERGGFPSLALGTFFAL